MEKHFEADTRGEAVGLALDWERAHSHFRRSLRLVFPPVHGAAPIWKVVIHFDAPEAGAGTSSAGSQRVAQNETKGHWVADQRSGTRPPGRRDAR
jgi:hypothetical protein